MKWQLSNYRDWCRQSRQCLPCRSPSAALLSTGSCSRTHSHTLTVTHPLTHTHAHSHTHRVTHALTHTHALAHTHAHTHSHTLTRTHALTHRVTHSFTHTRTHSRTHTHRERAERRAGPPAEPRRPSLCSRAPGSCLRVVRPPARVCGMCSWAGGLWADRGGVGAWGGARQTLLHLGPGLP